ncbi:sugar phosphate nucleotidyltransferase [Nitrincola alkalisediminis]|uniref:sugar phosphate nucleotidyltransferase n=1 Tax=Nitrincola alkalisediminis TaxID=1366656 RepID=UPI001875833A|nr:NTP transferase domain-containing protein [Nitrincola alkalisediminis]
MSLEVIILAAGKGSRMQSALPKVLHPLKSKPLIQWVIESAKKLNPRQIHLVVGYGADQVKAVVKDEGIQFASQHEQLGTGHAVAQAMPLVNEHSQALILYGDVPLISAITLNQLLTCATVPSVGLLTVVLDNPKGYGRVLRNSSGEVVAIVEEKDANDEQKLVREVNTGIMTLPASLLKSWLPKLSANNAQGEYYLTDIISIAKEQGIPIHAQRALSAEEVEGVNTLEQLASLEQRLDD